MQRHLIILIIILLTANILQAQTDGGGNQVVETLIEDLSENSDDEQDLEQLVEDLEYFLQNPINLNATTADELAKLHFLDEFQIQGLLNYLKHAGTIHSPYELQLISNFDQTTIFRLLPFVSFNEVSQPATLNLWQAMTQGRNELLTRAAFVCEQQDGYKRVSDSLRAAYPEKYYPGNSMRLFSRYSFNYRKRVMAGITAEKDPGEQFFAGHQKKGFDFYSAYIALSNIGHIKTLIVGDFQAKFGQGLIAWSGMSSGKSAFVMDLRKKGAGIKKYSSADENLFYRGIGTTIELGSVQASAFGSHKKVDATLIEADSTISDDLGFSAFGTSGLHATPNQIAKEDAISESVWGANISLNREHLKVGASGIGYMFDQPFVKKDAPLNHYDFEGRRGINISIDAQYTFNAIYLFGEAAVSGNGGKAVVAGSLLSLAPGLNASLLYRNYAKDYQARYANGFAEGSKTQNEEGFFFGIEAYPIKNWQLSAYYDIYRFPWMRTSANAPSRGNDMLVQINFTPARTLSMYWKFKTETCQSSGTTDNGGIQPLTDVTRWLLRYHINYAVGKRWQLKNRLELAGYRKGDADRELGCVIYQDVVCSPFAFPLSFSLRYAMFDTESYNSRVYLYESDVMYAYSIPMVYGRGIKAYLLATWKPVKGLTLSARASRLCYDDRNTIGTSPNKINSNHKTEVKIQMQLKF